MFGFLTAGTFFMIALALHIFFCIPLFVIAQKTRTDNEWMAFVPILNLYLMTEVAGLDWWYLLLMLVPCVGTFVGIYVWWEICEARDKPGWLSLLLLVPVVNIAVPWIVAFVD